MGPRNDDCAKNDTKAKNDADMKNNTNAKSDSNAKRDIDAKKNTDTMRNNDAKSYANAKNNNADGKSNAGAKSNANAKNNAGARSNAGAKTDAGAKSNADARNNEDIITPEELMNEARRKCYTLLDNINESSLPKRYTTLRYTCEQLSKRRAIDKKKEERELHLLAMFLLLFITMGLLGLMMITSPRSYFPEIYTHTKEKCLLTAPSVMRQLFRPPENCSICANVQQVDRLSAVDPAIFEQQYAYSGKPVVITDAMANWTAPKVFSFPFFKTLYHGALMNSERCQFFPYKTEFKSLQDVFEMSDDRATMANGSKPWYVGWSNCDEEIGAILRRHYKKPYFLPATAETKRTDWMFMGSRGYGAPMHVDNVDHPSWQAQIKGTKLWILEPPKECHYTCKKVNATVHPGEIIVLDTNRWYHETKIISDDLSITIGAEYD